MKTKLIMEFENEIRPMCNLSDVGFDSNITSSIP